MKKNILAPVGALLTIGALGGTAAAVNHHIDEKQQTEFQPIKDAATKHATNFAKRMKVPAEDVQFVGTNYTDEIDYEAIKISCRVSIKCILKPGPDKIRDPKNINCGISNVNGPINTCSSIRGTFATPESIETKNKLLRFAYGLQAFGSLELETPETMDELLWIPLVSPNKKGFGLVTLEPLGPDYHDSTSVDSKGHFVRTKWMVRPNNCSVIISCPIGKACRTESYNGPYEDCRKVEDSLKQVKSK